MASSVELEDCIIPADKRGEPAAQVFASKCKEGSVEMTQEAFEEAMTELGCVGFAADRTGTHHIFKKDCESITRTKYGSLRFVRTKTRKCRDVPCLILFLLYCTLMGFMCAWSLREGDPTRLIRATNFKGAVCGAGALANRSLIYFPELEQDMVKFAIMVAADPTKARIQNFKSAGDCVAACPRKGELFSMGGETYKVHFEQKEVLGRCFSKYPKSNLYFAKCKDFAPNASTVAARGGSSLPALDLPCAAYAEEWNLPRDRVCEELTGEFRAVTCLTKAAPCDSLMRTYYDPSDCCADAMKLVYPRCGRYSVGSGHYSDNPLLENPVFSQMMSASATLGRAFGDTSKASFFILLCGGIFTMLQGIVWSGLVQVVARPVVYFTLTLSVLIPLTLCLLFYAKSGLLDGVSAFTRLRDAAGLGGVFGVPQEATRPDMLALDAEMRLYKLLAYFFNAVFLVVFLVLVKLRKFIRVAVGMIKEASRALRQMPLMIVYPVWAVGMIFLLWFYFMFVAAHIASIESLDDIPVNGQVNATAGAMAAGLESLRAFTGGAQNGTVGSLTSSIYKYVGANNFTLTEATQIKGAIWLHTVGVLWGMNVINGIWCCTVAGAMCRWYWKFQEDKNHKQFEHMITWMSFKKTVRYFLGSVCYGAALITIMEITRLTFEYVIHQLKGALKNQKGNIARVAMAVRLGLMAMQKTLEEMTTGAYIMVVMQGSHFCVGATEARKLFKINATLIVTTELMSSFVLNLARVCCVTSSCLLLFACLEYDLGGPILGMVGLERPPVSSPIAPLLVCAIFALNVIDCYVDIVHMTIQALLLSYAADRELNDQTGMYAMTDSLRDFIVGDENPPFPNAKNHGFDDDDKTKPVKRLEGQAKLDADKAKEAAAAITAGGTKASKMLSKKPTRASKVVV